MDPLNALVQDLFTQLQKPITPAKVLVLLASAVRSLEALQNTSGYQKRDMALRAVHHIISKSDLSQEEKDVLNGILDAVGEATIDLLVSFGRDTVTFVKSRCHGKCPGCTII